MTRFFAAAVVAVGLVLAGCGVPAEPGAGGPTTPAGSTSSDPPAEPGGNSTLQDQLQGRSFETTPAEDVTGFDLVEGSALTLSFYLDSDGTPSIGGNAGCNSMGGAATWDGDTVRAADGLAQTEMACDGLMDQEAWWSEQLRAGLTLAFDDPFLTVTTADGAATIVMEDSGVLHPDLPLGSGTWRLTGIIDGEGDSAAVSSVPDGVIASLTFSRDHIDFLSLHVFDGLNWAAAPSGADDSSIEIEPDQQGLSDPLEATSGIVRVTGGMDSTAAGCAADRPDCFVAEMSLLAGDFRFQTHRENLTVTGLGDQAGHGLIFTLDPDAPAPDLSVEVPDGDNPLLGRTFELTGTFTDDGGADRKDPDAALRLTFHADTVSADGSCGEFTYQHISYIVDPGTPDGMITVDLGQPDRAGCVIGEDPAGPPEGRLWAGVDGDGLSLSTGFVAWNFRAVD